jgi:hypothetical protein
MSLGICEWSGCEAPATHTVDVEIPDLDPETWSLCRRHDREIKLKVVRSRPKKPIAVVEAIPNVVRCGGCLALLDERSDVAAGDRRPCSDCGSLVRNIELHVSDSVEMHDSVQVVHKAEGKGAWITKTRAGDNYTRDLEAWGARGLTLDRSSDLYSERIELWDGTRVESKARLSDHHD